MVFFISRHFLYTLQFQNIYFVFQNHIYSFWHFNNASRSFLCKACCLVFGKSCLNCFFKMAWRDSDSMQSVMSQFIDFIFWIINCSLVGYFPRHEIRLETWLIFSEKQYQLFISFCNPLVYSKRTFFLFKTSLLFFLLTFKHLMFFTRKHQNM